MISLSFPRRCVTAAGIAFVLAGALRSALAENDANLDSAQRIIALATTESRESGVVRLALKSLRDPDLLPLFKKLQESKNQNIQIDAMMAAVMATGDAKYLDMNRILAIKEDARLGAAIASIIDGNHVTNEQLKSVVDRESLEWSHRILAATELMRRKALPDHKPLVKVLEREAQDPGQLDVVRHYAAITLLESKNDAENAAALKSLMDMFALHEKRLERVQELMLLRVFKDRITLAAPWVKAIAQDFDRTPPGADDTPKEPRVNPRLAQAAAATLLALGDPEGPKVYEELINVRREIADQLVLGLTSIEFADKLSVSNIEKLGAGRTSQLVKSVRDVALIAVTKKGAGDDVTQGVMRLIQDGQPIVLNWSLGYSATAPKDRQIAIRTALVKQASILDEARGADYERAAVAAHKLIDEDGKEGRAAIAEILKGNNRAAIEASLLGMLRSDAKDLSEIILPVYKNLCRTPSNEAAANYATLLLAREGKKDSLEWLVGMINGGPVQNTGFRAIAAWQYAKLKGESTKLLERVIAEATTKPAK